MTKTRPDWNNLKDVRVSFFGYLRARPDLWDIKPEHIVEWYMGHMFATRRFQSLAIAANSFKTLAVEAEDWLVRNRNK